MGEAGGICAQCCAPSNWEKRIAALEDDVARLEYEVMAAESQADRAEEYADDDFVAEPMAERDVDGLRGVFAAVIAGDVVRARAELAQFELGLQAESELQAIIHAARRQARVVQAA